MLKIIEADGKFNVVNQETGETVNKKPFNTKEEAQAFMKTQQTAEDLTNAGAKPIAKPQLPGGAGAPPAGLEALLAGASGAGAPPMPMGMPGGPQKRPMIPGM